MRDKAAVLAIIGALIILFFLTGCASVRKMAEYWPVCGPCEVRRCQ